MSPSTPAGVAGVARVERTVSASGPALSFIPGARVTPAAVVAVAGHVPVTRHAAPCAEPHGAFPGEWRA